MLKIMRYSILLLLLISNTSYAQPCNGKFPNPITDICWRCLFPFSVGGASIKLGQKDAGMKPPLLCTCPAPPPVFVRPGIGISYWEPARVVEGVRTPMCSPFLGGTKLGTLPVPAGTNTRGHDTKESAFYQMHWYQYPILGMIMAGITQSICFIPGDTLDVAFITEIDPTWDDDALTTILNPEAVLFASLPAQAACAVDSIKAAATGFGIDTLFWCSGSQGSVYPLDGMHIENVGGIDSSLALSHRLAFKLHRVGLGMETGDIGAMCTGGYFKPILRKSLYKQQMLFPVAQTKRAYGLGHPSTLWAAGREFPFKGEDFAYLFWRKRLCCAL